MVIELTKTTTAQNCRRTQPNTGKPRRDMDGQNWRGVKWIAFGHLGKLFLAYLSLHQLHSWQTTLICYVAVILQM